jgi:hypothetical protein
MATGDYSGILMAGKRNAINDIGMLGEGVAGLGGAVRQRQINRDIRSELEKGEGHDAVTDYSEPMTSTDFTETTKEEAPQAPMPGLKPLIAMGAAPLTMTPLRGSAYTPGKKEDPRIPIMMPTPGHEPPEKPFMEPSLARMQTRRERVPGTDWKKVESLARDAEARGLKPAIGSAEIESRRRYEDQRELENRKLGYDMAQKETDQIVQGYDRAMTRRNGLAATLAQMEQVPLAQRSEAYNGMVAKLQSEMGDLNSAIRRAAEEGIRLGINPNRFVESGQEAEPNGQANKYTVTDFDNAWFSIEKKMDSKSSKADIRKNLVDAGLFENAAKVPQEIVNHIDELNKDRTSKDRDKENHDLEAKAKRQRIIAQNLSILNSQADSAAKGAAAKAELNSINAIPFGDYRQKNLWLQNRVNSGIGKVSGIDTGKILEMLNLDSFNYSQREFIDGQIGIMKAELAGKAKTAPKADKDSRVEGFD